MGRVAAISEFLRRRLAPEQFAPKEGTSDLRAPQVGRFAETEGNRGRGDRSRSLESRPLIWLLLSGDHW